MNCNRVCCIRLSTDMGHIYLFNVYLPCDTTNHENLCECNMVLTDIAKCCAENDVSNCIIGGDMNTDLSRVKSGNTISLHKFVSEEILSFVLKDRPNSIDYTYKGMNNNVSLIDILLFRRIYVHASRNIILKIALITYLTTFPYSLN